MYIILLATFENVQKLPLRKESKDNFLTIAIMIKTFVLF